MLQPGVPCGAGVAEGVEVDAMVVATEISVAVSVQHKVGVQLPAALGLGVGEHVVEMVMVPA